MDPNFFHLDWERTLEALAGVVILSFLVERACALLFESRWWISRLEDPRVGKARLTEGKSGGAADLNAEANAGETAAPKSHEQRSLPGHRYPLKEALGFILALAICWVWRFDAVSIILLSENTQLAGFVVTAAVVAGGSKGSVALFHDVLGIGSSAVKLRQEFKKRDAQL